MPAPPPSRLHHPGTSHPDTSAIPAPPPSHRSPGATAAPAPARARSPGSRQHRAFAAAQAPFAEAPNPGKSPGPAPPGPAPGPTDITDTTALGPPGALGPRSDRHHRRPQTHGIPSTARPRASPAPPDPRHQRHPQTHGHHRHPQTLGITGTPRPTGISGTPRPTGITGAPRPIGHHRHPQTHGHHRHPQTHGHHRHPRLTGITGTPRPTGITGTPGSGVGVGKSWGAGVGGKPLRPRPGAASPHRRGIAGTPAPPDSGLSTQTPLEPPAQPSRTTLHAAAPPPRPALRQPRSILQSPSPPPLPTPRGSGREGSHARGLTERHDLRQDAPGGHDRGGERRRHREGSGGDAAPAGSTGTGSAGAPGENDPGGSARTGTGSGSGSGFAAGAGRGAGSGGRLMAAPHPPQPRTPRGRHPRHPAREGLTPTSAPRKSRSRSAPPAPLGAQLWAQNRPSSCPAPAQNRPSTGPEPAQHRPSTGSAPAQHRLNTGPAPAQHWHNAAASPAQRWPISGTSDGGRLPHSEPRGARGASGATESPGAPCHIQLLAWHSPPTPSLIGAIACRTDPDNPSTTAPTPRGQRPPSTPERGGVRTPGIRHRGSAEVGILSRSLCPLRGTCREGDKAQTPARSRCGRTGAAARSVRPDPVLAQPLLPRSCAGAGTGAGSESPGQSRTKGLFQPRWAPRAPRRQGTKVRHAWHRQRRALPARGTRGARGTGLCRGGGRAARTPLAPPTLRALTSTRRRSAGSGAGATCVGLARLARCPPGSQRWHTSAGLAHAGAVPPHPARELPVPARPGPLVPPLCPLPCAAGVTLVPTPCGVPKGARGSPRPPALPLRTRGISAGNRAHCAPRLTLLLSAGGSHPVGSSAGSTAHGGGSAHIHRVGTGVPPAQLGVQGDRGTGREQGESG
ncbi:collagen alpha-1(III) chain-like [Melozone crissalis]|uniref:collagen alpha-1(III) chain-like n=1 Tax=Melozone crissalis TaxID=40204 RepID=UPI0023D97FE1|nr:collagen alpha-1(III) chain-like [Melozone crissalis]